MKIVEMVFSIVGYISEGVSRLFSPSDDAYPKTGVQPFEGDAYSEWVDAPRR
jgi:hypothetical protein